MLEPVALLMCDYYIHVDGSIRKIVEFRPSESFPYRDNKGDRYHAKTMLFTKRVSYREFRIAEINFEIEKLQLELASFT